MLLCERYVMSLIDHSLFCVSNLMCHLSYLLYFLVYLYLMKWLELEVEQLFQHILLGSLLE